MVKPLIFKGKRSPAIAIIGFFIFSISLVLLITLDLDAIPMWVIPLGTVWMTLMFTGLFITVHDSMHGAILPGNQKVNQTIGAVSIFFYALFSYRKLKEKHMEHHRYPGTSKDPDYHDGKHRGLIRWYLRFMGLYISPYQVIGMAVVFNLLVFLAGLKWSNLILFWIIPSLGSTLQLFYFGTYLPHLEPDGGYTNEHHARSSNFPYVISLLTCYHFGYHLEHHMYPYVQWWRLPRVRKRILTRQ